jgi:hypothetical protein
MSGFMFRYAFSASFKGHKELESGYEQVRDWKSHFTHMKKSIAMMIDKIPSITRNTASTHGAFLSITG